MMASAVSSSKAIQRIMEGGPFFFAANIVAEMRVPRSGAAREVFSLMEAALIRITSW
jgi:hypothetical protein